MTLPAQLLCNSSYPMPSNRYAWSANRIVSMLKCVAVAIGTITMSASPVSAEPLVQISGGSTIGAWDDSTFGWDFTTGSQSINVEQLGIFDQFEDGLVEPHQVGLWRVSDGALLSSTTVSSGTSATLIDGFRYAPTDPVLLAPSTDYVLGAYYSTNADGLTWRSSVAMNFGAEFGRGRTTGGPNSGFAQPQSPLAPAQAEGFFGPNLLVGFLPGDVNGDNLVNFQDFLALQVGFGITSGAARTDGDLNADGDVDFQDFLELQVNFGSDTDQFSGTAAATSVPEPSSLALLSVAMVWIVGWRRRV